MTLFLNFLMKKPKYLEIAEYYPGSAQFRKKEDFYAWPCRMMEELGYNTEILTLIRNDGMKKEEVVRGIGVRRFENTLSLLAYVKKDKDIELVFSFLRPNLPSLLSCIAGKKSILTPLTYILGSNKLVETLSLFFMKRFDRIIALTPYERDLYIKKGLSSAKVVLLPFSVDYDYFSKRPRFDAGQLRKKYGISKNYFVIIAVAHIRPVKNMDIIVKAFSIFNKKVNNSKLIIIGKDISGNVLYKEQKGRVSKPLKEIAKELGVEEDVVVTGLLQPDEIRKLLYISNLFVNSSSLEAQCIAVYEAGAAGLPVCLSRIGSFTSVFGNRVLYHEPKDAEQLAENYYRYFKDKKLREKSSTELRKFVKEWDYSINKRKMKKLFEEVLDKKL